MSAVIKPVTCIGPAMIDEPLTCICPDCQPLRRALDEDRWAAYDDEPDRCEADHRKGGVCQRRLTLTGRCPGEADHA